MFKTIKKLFNFKSLCVLISVLSFALSFAVFVFVDAGENSHSFKLGVIFFACAALVCIAVWVLFFLSNGFRSTLEREEVNTVLGGKALDLLDGLYCGTAICDHTGKIIWTNEKMKEILKIGNSSHANISIITEIPFDDMIREEGYDVSFKDSYYRIRGYAFSSSDNSKYILFWEDRGEIERAYIKNQDESLVVAHVFVDNIDDLIQNDKTYYRTISSKVEKLLKNWSDSVGGFLLEYEKDKYIFLFEAQYLKKFREDNFSILDETRDIRYGENGLPVTLSIGVSSQIGSLSEKEETALGSLEMALSRGGDQAVIKTENSHEFFGGKSKGVQKNSRVKARVTATKLAGHIASSDKVLVMGHRNMDFDALGGCVGIARLCMHCGIDVHIIAHLEDENLKKCFDMLRKLPEYKNIFIDASTAQDMITSETLLIITDVNNKRQFESPEVAQSVYKYIVIDHHRLLEEFERAPLIQYIETSASSCCELVSEIIEHSSLIPGEFKPEEATMMLAGILLDTKQFSRNIGTRTFSASLFLRSEGADIEKAQELFKTNIDEYIREAQFKKNIEIFKSDFIIAANLSAENDSSVRITAAKVADSLLTIDGAEASFAVCLIDDAVNISARSNGKVNVQIIMESLGGGGHFDAAATQIKNMSIDEAVAKLKECIDNYLNN